MREREGKTPGEVSRFDQGEIDSLLPALVAQGPRLGHAMGSDQVGDTGGTGGTSTAAGVRLPEPVQMNDVCSANESLEVGLGSSECQTIR